MSQPSSTANLLLNGDFSNGGEHWSPTNVDKVRYADGYCALQTPGSITQEVKLDKGGAFRFSAKMRTHQDAYGRVRLMIEPSWSIIDLDLGNGEDWTVDYKDFFVGDDATSLKIKLEAADGSFEDFGVYVDNVVLERR
ncbi:hypothetical protein [Pseudomonas sp. F01002]|uniref:hypothetical protein n=1 Tax=Pseudomonas TaxID=286 RepID=UPI00106AC8ED|nr:hypothetical protein [Pseudomonas sp. F01002]TFB44507.1 hypothetical protein E3W21_03370 [Pseudomonas sp. F01002]